MIKLSDISSIVSGINPDSSPEGTCHFLQIRHLVSDNADCITARRPTAGRAVTVADGDVLLAARGDHAFAVRARPSQIGAYIALDLYLIRPESNQLDSDYLAAFLMLPSTGTLLRKSTAGASLPRIPKDALTSLDIPLPPIDHQRAIGGVASCIRRHRELTGRLVLAETILAETSIERAFARFD